MSQQISLLVVSLGEYRFAFPAAQVQRVLRAAAVTPIPDAPPAMHGVLDLQGKLLPVLSGRLTFGLEESAVEPEDCFVVFSSTTESFVLVVDRVEGVSVAAPADFIFNGVSAGVPPEEGQGSAGGGRSLLRLSNRLHELARYSSGSLPYAVRLQGELLLLCSADSIANELWSNPATPIVG